MRAGHNLSAASIISLPPPRFAVGSAMALAGPMTCLPHASSVCGSAGSFSAFVFRLPVMCPIRLETLDRAIVEEGVWKAVSSTVWSILGANLRSASATVLPSDRKRYPTGVEPRVNTLWLELTLSWRPRRGRILFLPSPMDPVRNKTPLLPRRCGPACPAPLVASLRKKDATNSLCLAPSSSPLDSKTQLRSNSNI